MVQPQSASQIEAIPLKRTCDVPSGITHCIWRSQHLTAQPLRQTEHTHCSTQKEGAVQIYTAGGTRTSVLTGMHARHTANTAAHAQQRARAAAGSADKHYTQTCTHMHNSAHTARSTQTLLT